MRKAAIAIGVLVILLLTGCTAKQVYGGLQAMQQSECNRRNDMEERRQCMSKAGVSHEDYKRQHDQ